MATLIETEEAAKRLARVILSDVQLYNKDLIASGGDLTHALHEGRHHFKSRVVERMYGVFDQVAIERKLMAGAAVAPEDGPPMEKTPAVLSSPASSILSSNDRPTPVSIAVKTLEAVTPVPVVRDEPAPVEVTPPPVKVAPAPVKVTPAPVTAPPAQAPRTPSVRPAPMVAKPAPAMPPARAVQADLPMEKTPPPIPERARPAPVQITITATPPPPAPMQMPWPPAASAPNFSAPEEPAPYVSGFASAPPPVAVDGDTGIPNLKPPFPWIRIILLIAAAVGAVAAVVHLTR